MPDSPRYILKAVAVFAAILVVAIRHARRHHPFPRLGPANMVTAVRALLTALVAALIGEPQLPAVAVAAVVVGTIAAVLDAVDGWLARRTRMSSAFGARFDMEIDALLILALACLVWLHLKAGAWILAAGLLRYAFVAAGLVWPWMARPLAPTLRARAICIAQIATLLIALLPAVTQPVSAIVAAAGLAALVYSFGVDTLRLARQRAEATGVQVRLKPDVTYATLVAAVALLNASLTFGNLWPTPAITFLPRLSVEFAAAVLLLVAIASVRGAVSSSAVAGLSALWVVFVIGHYADVTAPALYGREINLYWDLRLMPDVASMITRVAPLWLIALALAVGAAFLFLMYAAARWALRRVAESAARVVERRVLAAAAIAIVLLFVVDRQRARPADESWFAAPVAETYAHQARLIARSRDQTAIPAGPVLNSDLSRVAGADVLLVFVESYGAVAFDRPDISAGLAPSREAFAAAIAATGRRVVSAFVESPTFGGSSWLAHLSLISGVEVRDADTNALLMTEHRDTMVSTFSRGGFRTVALMPGLRQNWPEGRFYGFDQIYGADRLAYHGPEFGWFAIPDQYSLAKLDALEHERRQPLFVFFPTISTHFPFSPTPPYQPQWDRMLDAKPYDDPALVRAYSREPDWTDFAPGYVDAMTYDFATLAGYLRAHGDDDIVMIVLGDHQPAAAVSGEHASRDVPVHVIASRPDVLDRLVAGGFQPGLTPPRRSLCRMNALLPVLLDAFGKRMTE